MRSGAAVTITLSNGACSGQFPTRTPARRAPRIDGPALCNLKDHVVRRELSWSVITATISGCETVLSKPIGNGRFS
jgi:hypothetical protein